MEIIQTGGVLLIIGVVAAVLIVALIVGLLIARAWVKVARSDEALVVSGRVQKTADGDSPVTVIVNGKALVNPITQRFETISLRSRQVNMTVNAQSADGVTLEVEAVAIVKIGSEPGFVRRAAERFASQDKAIEQFTTEQLEGALRGVVATLSVVSLMRERKKFSDQIAQDVSGELGDQGLILDSFQIKGISDAVGYINSLGRPEIEERRKAAEIAATDAERAIAQRTIANQENNLIEQTALDKNTADASAQIGRARAEAEQAEALARATAEQRVLQQEAENKQARLDADVKRVADADLYRTQREADAAAYQQIKAAEASAEIAAREAEATRLRAQADADSVTLAGQAKAGALRAEAEALRENQEAIIAQRAIDVLPALMDSFAKGYAQIGKITVVGDGGSGDLAGRQFSGESATAVAGVFETLKATVGIDLAEVIQGRAVGSAIGDGIRGEAKTAPGSVLSEE